jgi:hypothetical protein
MTGLGVKRAMAAMVVGIAYSKSKGRELESVRAIFLPEMKHHCGSIMA